MAVGRAAVPSPVEYKWLRLYWQRALKAVGADETLRLHDVRHLTAQLLVNAGQSEASVQTTMRHATASMTRRYAMQKDRGDNATALARVLLDSPRPDAQGATSTVSPTVGTLADSSLNAERLVS